MKFRQKLNSSESYFNPQPIPKNESDKEAHIKCSDIEGAKKYCPTRWAALERWFAESRKVTCTCPPPPAEGGVGVLRLIFAWYVPLASQSPNPITVYSVANYRPHLSHFWANM